MTELACLSCDSTQRHQRFDSERLQIRSWIILLKFHGIAFSLTRKVFDSRPCCTVHCNPNSMTSLNAKPDAPLIQKWYPSKVWPALTMRALIRLGCPIVCTYPRSCFEPGASAGRNQVQSACPPNCIGSLNQKSSVVAWHETSEAFPPGFLRPALLHH